MRDRILPTADHDSPVKRESDNIANAPNFNNRFVSLAYFRGKTPRLRRALDNIDNLKIVKRSFLTIRWIFNKVKQKNPLFFVNPISSMKYRASIVRNVILVHTGSHNVTYRVIVDYTLNVVV